MWPGMRGVPSPGLEPGSLRSVADGVAVGLCGRGAHGQENEVEDFGKFLVR